MMIMAYIDLDYLKTPMSNTQEVACSFLAALVYSKMVWKILPACFCKKRNLILKQWVSACLLDTLNTGFSFWLFNAAPPHALINQTNAFP